MTDFKVGDRVTVNGCGPYWVASVGFDRLVEVYSAAFDGGPRHVADARRAAITAVLKYLGLA